VGVHNKHSRNVPKSFASKSSGELFLGTYTFNGTAKRTDGISFSSRPTSLTFTYSYEPVANEEGLVYIGIVGENGSIISEFRTDLSAATNNQTTLALPAYPFGIKPAGIRLSFKSSKNVISVPVPTDLDDVTTTLATSGGKSIPANQYKTLCVGSKLTISNVKLNY
ncbi:MAG: hypothetical protein K2K29_03495, partial [Muribaculaceae bacterium]|nr:hypothetical protein [Muribaculaceae bacterium]